MGATAAGVS